MYIKSFLSQCLIIFEFTFDDKRKVRYVYGETSRSDIRGVKYLGGIEEQTESTVAALYAQASPSIVLYVIKQRGIMIRHKVISLYQMEVCNLVSYYGTLYFTNPAGPKLFALTGSTCAVEICKHIEQAYVACGYSPGMKKQKRQKSVTS